MTTPTSSPNRSRDAVPSAVAEQLRRQWREGRQLDVRTFLADQAEVSLAELTEVLRVDQRERWLRGERIPVEQYLRDFFPLEDSPEHALDLVYAEYLLREELGEAPALEEYLERFPQLADTLRLQLDFHRALGASGAVSSSEESPSEVVAVRKTVESGGGATKPPSYWPAVEGYEVVGVLGRGGMGVVYKAWQRRLKRLVALKMVRGGPERDAEHRGRFRAEYEILARLRHPNIVQIYEAGEVPASDSGVPVPFFSLEYVEGGSLDQVLAGRPQAARETAELIRTLAQAVQHAHEAGVVHRDLKPANVLLSFSREPPASADAALAGGSRLNEAVPKVTDFGLAKLVDPGPAAGGHTLSGQVIGTPCYLSPEQAAASTGTVGAGVDVWALGAILYECLTGRPPFQGATLLETLEQVRSRDPVTPSRLRTGVPRDLEIICLKCLEKEPERRYASARELSEDLGRFLEGRPICARPASAWERGLKWARRRPAITALLLALATSLLGLIGLGAWSYVRIREALALAETRRVAAEEQKSEAIRKGEEARRLSAEAHRNADLAARSVGKFWTAVAREMLLNRPGLERLRQQFYKGAAEFYEELVKGGSEDPETRAAQGAAYMRYAQLTAKMTNPKEALPLARKGFDILRRLVSEVPDNFLYRADLARAHTEIGDQLTQTVQFDAAEGEYRAALRLFDAMPRPHQNQAEYENDRASVHHNLGLLYVAMGSHDRAEKSYHTALAVRKRLVRDHKDASYKSALAMTQTELVNLFTATGRSAEAEGPCREALAVYRELEQADRNNLRHRVDLGRGCLSLGTVFLQTRRPAKAVGAFDEAVRLFGKLESDYSGIVENRHGLAVARMMRGNALDDIKEQRRAEADYEAAGKLFAELIRTTASVGEHTLGLAACEGNLALLRRDRGQLKEAHVGLTRAITVVKELLAVQPRHGPARELLHKSLVDRSGVSGRLGRHTDTVKDLDDALQELTGPRRGDLLVQRAIALARTGDHEKAAAQAGQLTGPRTSPPTRYNLACVWSLCGSAVLADTRLPLAKRLARAGVCSANGFALLRQAARDGFFRSPGERQLLRTDTDLELLRTQGAYQDLLRSIQDQNQ